MLAIIIEQKAEQSSTMNKFENFIKNQIVPTLPQVFPSWGKQSDNTGEKVMRKSEHTPGPWKTSGFSISAKGSGYIAKALEVYMKRSEREANARLIAAAPDLLVALKQARQSMLDSGYSIDSVAVMSCSAAISKAEGEA